ncbi:PKD domain-containing protein [Luteolibacter soli]|uniref:PKD domain-containing protein n=1 Tax=Luteolibacter soli TaxID=3135280 RepID=A0ABU9AZG7_9BACT
MRRVLGLLLIPGLVCAERINQEGRILGDVPTVTQSVLFNTPQADAVVSAMQIMPRDNPWNEDISTRPVLSNSPQMITKIGSELASDRQNLRLFEEMNYVLVPESQPKIPISFFEYDDESDLDGGTIPVGLYPIPTNLPVETWPTGTGSMTLEDWQADDDDSDRHSITVKPGSGFIWETWMTKRIGTSWEAANGAKFSLNSNALRPAGWTSGDAAGLPMFPALVRYDECQRGMVEHAMRIVVAHTRRAYIYPATHHASKPDTTDANTPAMGQRLRLKADFVIPTSWTIQEKAVALGLKKYGAFVADNGGFFSISITPDDRYPSGCFNHLKTLLVTNFEVIQTTGATEGPRSAGTLTANAGPDVSVTTGSNANLSGVVTSTLVSTVQWKLYSGPATVTFGNASQAITTATFPVPGTYTLMLSAKDGVHTPAYDAVKVEVTLPVTVTRVGGDIRVSFPSVSGHNYRVERSGDLSAWQAVGANVPGTGGMLQVTHTGASGAKQFYRVVVLD